MRKLLLAIVLLLVPVSALGNPNPPISQILRDVHFQIIIPPQTCSGIPATSVLFVNASGNCAGDSSQLSWDDTFHVLNVPNAVNVGFQCFGAFSETNCLTNTRDNINLPTNSSIGWYDASFNRDFLESNVGILTYTSHLGASESGPVAFSRQFSQISGTTTAATSDTFSGAIETSSTCVFSAANASAATNIATSFISAVGTGTVTLTHTATSGMIYNFVCINP